RAVAALFVGQSLTIEFEGEREFDPARAGDDEPALVGVLDLVDGEAALVFDERPRCERALDGRRRRPDEPRRADLAHTVPTSQGTKNGSDSSASSARRPAAAWISRRRRRSGGISPRSSGRVVSTI